MPFCSHIAYKHYCDVHFSLFEKFECKVWFEWRILVIFVYSFSQQLTKYFLEQQTQRGQECYRLIRCSLANRNTQKLS